MTRRGDGGASRVVVCAFLTAIVLVAFAPLLGNGFVNYDDPLYVTRNPMVRGGLTLGGARWAVTAVEASNWHPLTWLSHMLDCTLFGLDARGHHLTSLVLHAANAAMLFLALRRLTGALGPSAAVAALFAVHPLRVESVAWVAERKDVLSAFFGFLTLWAWARYTEAPGWRRYLAVLSAFALGLAAKPMLVTLPFVLLLLDYWPLQRSRIGNLADGGRRASFATLVLEKVPLLALAAASAIVTVVAQGRGRTFRTLSDLPLLARLANAAVSLAAYIGKTLWPARLSVFYPHPGDGIPPWEAALAVLFLAGATAIAIRVAPRRPYVPVGWLWYLGTLVPVLGIVQVGEQAMADRYTYVPGVGLLIVVAWGAWDALGFPVGSRRDTETPVDSLRRTPRASWVAAAVAVAVAALGIATFRQCRVWRDSTSLFEHALRVTERNHTAHVNLGIALREQGRNAEAAAHFEEALRLRPDLPEARNGLGLALAAQGRLPEAMDEYRKILSVHPEFAPARTNLGAALTAQGRLAEAAEEYAAAIAIDPSSTDARSNLGVVLAMLGRLDEAGARFDEAIRIDPFDPEPRYNWAVALGRAGRWSDAVARLRGLLEVDPDHAEARFRLGVALRQLGQEDEGGREIEQALRMGFRPRRGELERIGLRADDPTRRAPGL